VKTSSTKEQNHYNQNIKEQEKGIFPSPDNHYNKPLLIEARHWFEQTQAAQIAQE
jgi:hypothetical protein